MGGFIWQLTLIFYQKIYDVWFLASYFDGDRVGGGRVDVLLSVCALELRHGPHVCLFTDDCVLVT